MAKRKRPAPPPRFLVLARTGSGSWPHPVEVGLHAAGAHSVVSFSVGPHAVNAGGRVPLANVVDADGLNPLFAVEFDAADLHWAVPLLVRLRSGEDVEDEIVAAYRERTGGPPERMS